MTEDSTQKLNEFDVSESWKSKFEILEKIGANNKFVYAAMSSEEFKSLTFKEKQKINFNVFAFLFGPFYYFTKKMWLKGAVLFGGIVLLNTFLTLIEIAINSPLPAVVYWIPGSVVCAQLANYDYYRYIVKKENMWEQLSIFSKPMYSIMFSILSFVLLLSVSYFSSQGVPKCGSSDVTKLVAIIADREMAKQLGVAAAQSFTYDVEAIRTSSTDEKTGAHECAAELKINSNNGKSNSIPITYTVENTDDGKDIYVNVFGL